jgi:hypothetical protein
MENTINKIIDLANILGKESERQIKEYDKFNKYIKPLFMVEFGVKYESSLHSMYQGEKRKFLNFHKNKK